MGLHAANEVVRLMADNPIYVKRACVPVLRLFTVYGPWGRPDMALFLFARAIMEGRTIEVFNHGHHTRDCTYVEDIVQGIVWVTDRVPAPDPAWNSVNPDPASSSAPCRLYNIDSNRPVELVRYIEVLGNCLGRRAKRIMKSRQLGDVSDTFADVDELIAGVGCKPDAPIEVGMRNFVEWF